MNENEINDIYNNFIKTKNNVDYRDKRKDVLTILNTTNWKWENKDFSRVISLLEFKEYINNATFKKSLIFNGHSDPELQYLNTNAIIHFDYENNKEYDLHSFQSDERFDFFMLNQTLEHTYDPCLVLRNVYNIMNEGGLIYINVPSLCPPHNTPFHYYNGFTPTGLGAIVRQAGFEICDIGYWGNKEYVQYLFEHNDWPDYKKLKDYTNNIDYAVISWVFAKKEK